MPCKGVTVELTQKLEVLWCRTFQSVLKVGNYFMGYRVPEYIEGPGKIKELGACLKEKGINDVLVVTGTGMVRRGQVQPMLDGFEANGIRYTLQTYSTTDPTSDDVELGYKAYKEYGCKSIVAIGGGSRIDCAKGIAAKAVHPKKTVAKLQGLLKVHRPIPPFVAIPTTAGAGSETTVAAVITDSTTHRKAAINDPFLIPKYAVLDPELTVGLPPYTTATTGMDALAHAVEAYTNKTYNTKLENKLAKEAVKLIHDNILVAYEDGSNLEARQNMQRGAFCAGRAFTRGCVGYVHAIGHTLGGLYGVAHGLAMAVLLPHVMKQFGPSVHKRLADLADVCGMVGRNDAEKADAFIRWIEEINKKMGLPDKFDVIQDEDIDQMITWAKKEANPLYPVPTVWGRKDFRRLIESVRK
ncbi:MAG: iron-containing alcohol dehydrogenase [Oscillospiraceae bacterium]|nr:iron-containing alcohol dehydrogenase [Oscillospiraceae bacterium]